jgi:hypothetical protein
MHGKLNLKKNVTFFPRRDNINNLSGRDVDIIHS